MTEPATILALRGTTCGEAIRELRNALDAAQQTAATMREQEAVADRKLRAHHILLTTPMHMIERGFGWCPQCRGYGLAAVPYGPECTECAGSGEVPIEDHEEFYEAREAVGS